jgi:hypothetical protein
MARKPLSPSVIRAAPVACAVWLCCLLAPGAPAVGAFAHGRALRSWTDMAAGYSASLEQCTPSAVPAARSATFTGEMVATPATQRMAMRIELLEHVHGEPGYSPVSAPGLGVWRRSEAGVKLYRYVKQITNLQAPAVYRAIVHFRWLGEKGRVIKRAEARTARCVQPLLSPPLAGERSA